MTVLKDAYTKACEVAANDVNNFIWKGPKVNGVQEEIKLINCSFEQLQKFYNHSMEMLNNNDYKNPGRNVLLGIVQDQIQRCRAELLIRWLKSEKKYTAMNCLEDLRNVIRNNKDELTQETIKIVPIGQVMNGIPIEFERVPISLVMDACLDSLGVYSGEHLTLNFIVKMGLWFTPQELQKTIEQGGLYEKDPITGKAKNRLEIVKRELRLNPAITLKINNTGGLSYSEFRSMVRLKKDKYANLTSDQLKLLSNKILYRFQNQCMEQAKQWENKIAEIIKIGELKGWDVTRKID
jgi:hypothetical protein